MTMRRGFSLIEVMVSLTLLAIVVMSLARVSTVISIRARSTDVVAKRMAVLQMEANNDENLKNEMHRKEAEQKLELQQLKSDQELEQYV